MRLCLALPTADSSQAEAVYFGDSLDFHRILPRLMIAEKKRLDCERIWRSERYAPATSRLQNGVLAQNMLRTATDTSSHETIQTRVAFAEAITRDYSSRTESESDFSEFRVSGLFNPFSEANQSLSAIKCVEFSSTEAFLLNFCTNLSPSLACQPANISLVSWALVLLT